jgi:radical SAM superfamily enzyme YgiQ (UPF0313 family)
VRIALLNPNFSDHRSADALPPLVYAVLRALTPEGVDTVFYDERVERLPLDALEADLAALSVQTFTARRAYAIAGRLRARGIRVVLGGIHPTLLPDEAAPHADALVVGDAEPVWARLVEDARGGRLAPRYHGDVTAPLGGVTPDRRIFAGKRYARVNPVQFGRGCRFACDFCSVRAVYGSSRRLRPVGEVVAEIGALEERFLFFVDDNLLLDPDATRELLDGLRPLGARWACQVSLDASLDEDLLRRMRESGCVLVFVGFESLDPGSLREMGKTVNIRVAGFAEAVRRFRRHGLMVGGAFVFGYDRDTPETIAGALRFALDERLALAHFNAAMPTPATPLYRRLEEQGRLRHDRWWVDPSFRYGDAMFTPRGMSPADLADGCRAARVAFNSWGNIARRAFEPASNSRTLFNLRTYLGVNAISRREIRRKHGLRLG